MANQNIKSFLKKNETNISDLIDIMLRLSKRMEDFVCKSHSLGKEKSPIIFMESMIFLVHIISRTSFSVLPKEWAHIFMDALADVVVAGWSSDENDIISSGSRNKISGWISSRHEEYCKYRLDRGNHEVVTHYCAVIFTVLSINTENFTDYKDFYNKLELEMAQALIDAKCLNFFRNNVITTLE